MPERKQRIQSTEEIRAAALISLRNSRARRKERERQGRNTRIGVLAVIGATIATAVGIGMVQRGEAKADNRTEVPAAIRRIIPAYNEPYRVLRAGGERDGIVLVNVVSLRDYIFRRMGELSPTKKPLIERDLVTKLIMAENIDYQLHELGRDPKKVNPLYVTSDQPYRLPVDWGVGKFHPPDTPNGQ